MASLKELVEKHGFGIRVKSQNRVLNQTFTVKGEGTSTGTFTCQVEGGKPHQVLKEWPTCNDYEIVK